MGFSDDRYFLQDIQTPSTDIPEDRKTTASRAHYNAVQANEQLYIMTGIDVETGGFNRDEAGNLKIFEIAEDGSIKDPLEDCAFNSLEFMEKVQSGRIMVFPAGDKDPVQLQITTNTDGTGGVWAASKPVKDTPVKKPAPLSFFTRFRHFFGGAKKEYTEYNSAMEKYNKSLNSIKEIKDKRSEELLNNEKKEYEDHAAEREQLKNEAEAQAHQEELEILKGPADKYKSEQMQKMDTVVSFYQTKPQIEDEFVSYQYNLDEFSQLKPYDISKMNVNGPIDDTMFASVAVNAALDPSIGGKIRHHEGVSMEENIAGNMMFFTSDLFGNGAKIPRPRVGQYFKDGEAKGREAANKAFEEYNKGNKKPLAEMIGKGIHFMAEYGDRTDLSDSNIVNNAITAKSLELLERDPELMQHAKEAGLTEKDINIAKGDLKTLEIVNANEWAKKRMEAAEKGEIELTEQEKADAIKARVEYQMLKSSVNIHCAKAESTEEYAIKMAEAQGPHKAGQAKQKALNDKWVNKEITQEEWSKQNKILNEEMEFASAYMFRQMNVAKGRPEIYEKMGADPNTLNNLIKRNIPDINKFKNMTSAELENAVVNEINANAEKQAQEIAQQNKPAQPAVNKQLQGSIADRAKMFENKQPTNPMP